MVAGYTVHGARNRGNICPIGIQHRERPGCGNTASESAWDGWMRPRRCQPHFPGWVHQSHRAYLSRKWWGRLPNPRLRRASQCEKPSAPASKPRWNWRERFLSGSSPPKYASIAITPAIVRPAHGVATVVGVVKDRDFSRIVLRRPTR